MERCSKTARCDITIYSIHGYIYIEQQVVVLKIDQYYNLRFIFRPFLEEHRDVSFFPRLRRAFSVERREGKSGYQIFHTDFIYIYIISHLYKFFIYESCVNYRLLFLGSIEIRRDFRQFVLFLEYPCHVMSCSVISCHIT